MNIVIRFILIASLSSIVSCSIVDIRDESHYSVHSGRIAEPIEKIVPGTTTKQWLLENFGEPNSNRYEADGTEYLNYQFDEHVKLKTRILFLFNYQSKKVVRREMEIALEDGVVSRVGSQKNKKEVEEPPVLLGRSPSEESPSTQVESDLRPTGSVMQDQAQTE